MTGTQGLARTARGSSPATLLETLLEWSHTHGGALLRSVTRTGGACRRVERVSCGFCAPHAFREVAAARRRLLRVSTHIQAVVLVILPHPSTRALPTTSDLEISGKMRAVLLAASAAACANALQVAFYTSADCSGAPVVSAYTGNKKCTSVMSTFGMMPYQCGGGSAQLAVYGDPSCGGSPAPGTLISASTTCSALPPR